MTSRPRTRSRKTAIAVQEESLLLRWLKERHITEVECLVPVSYTHLTLPRRG